MAVIERFHIKLRPVISVAYILTAAACISPLDVTKSVDYQWIVVDGMITDQPGPYLVKLYKTVSVETPLAENEYLTAAVTPNSTPIIGIFNASAVKKKYLTLDRSDVPYYLPPIDCVLDDCTSVYKNGTVNKPSFW